MPGHAGVEPSESVLNDRMGFLKGFLQKFPSFSPGKRCGSAVTLMGRYGSATRCTTVVLRLACESVEMDKLRLLACCEGRCSRVLKKKKY